ncbi:DctP family TRAP transporter solute-binding subunit [Hoeflea ulvae]|uniref:DctP family TRAP transporter solute-binding subunit n=1 Tax=Hoeflea ulvae TaxID=2983764 RepID=A0ABT3YGX8_9HYPH|nr:DctP family TRAP transporter solute-binding subunit [Hoeflea ulvae]MCY0095143.1 DctP family TRAP transporter solute-binding subunit [Hoeflea ulvae]
MKKNLVSILSVAALALATTAAAAETRLKFGHPAPDTDLSHVMIERFAEAVKAGTDGSVVIDIFPNGQLGTDDQMIDGVTSGILDFTLSGLNNFTGMVPEAGAFTLPFMFPNRETAYKVLDGAPGKGVLANLEEFGIKGLGFAENGYRNITNNRGPIRTPVDLSGLVMRVNNSKALNDLFLALDANPQQIPVAELYTALETGVVNAQDHPIWVVEAFKFYEVQKYLSLSQHAYSALTIAMNLEKFNGLTAEEQATIESAAAEAVAFQRTASQAAEEEKIKFLEGEGMVVNRDVDGAAFQEAAKPVWTSFIEENGDTLINEILAASK